MSPSRYYYRHYDHFAVTFLEPLITRIRTKYVAIRIADRREDDLTTSRGVYFVRHHMMHRSDVMVREAARQRRKNRQQSSVYILPK